MRPNWPCWRNTCCGATAAWIALKWWRRGWTLSGSRSSGRNRRADQPTPDDNLQEGGARIAADDLRVKILSKRFCPGSLNLVQTTPSDRFHPLIRVRHALAV